MDKASDIKLLRANFPDLTPIELDKLQFVWRSSGLSPLTGKIVPQVYTRRYKDGNEWKTKRSFTIITTIDGYRSIANRTGDYRPGPRSIAVDPELRSETNPHGIVSATAEVQKFSHGEWHAYSETVWWDEYAPVTEEWNEDDSGRRKPTGKQSLAKNSTWYKQGRNMLMKCAEAQALRRGWPDELEGLDAEELMDQVFAVSTAAEIMEDEARKQREKMIGGLGHSLQFGNEIESVTQDKVFGRVMDHIRTLTPEQIAEWRDLTINRYGLRNYWSQDRDSGDALKAELDKAQGVT